MKIIFIGGFFPQESMNQIRNDSIGAISNANNALQWGFINGINSHINLYGVDDFKIVSIPQIGAFPSKYRKSIFKPLNESFGENQGLNGVCCSFNNVVGFKHVSRYFSIRKCLFKQLMTYEKDDNILIIVYDLQAPILKAIAEIKKVYTNLRLCLIVPDLHEYTGRSKSILHRSFEFLEKKALKSTNSSVDSYCLISKYMIDKLDVGDRPWIVIEGIYNVHDENYSNKRDSTDEKIIFYSGALNRRNNVNNLLKAFSLIDRDDFRLILCGDGELREDILKIAEKDSRIDYRGQLPRYDVLRMQSNATLLVNPRVSNDEFTKYSFPSKTIEYFASNIPVIMYKLEGIPEEYYVYCHTPKDESVEELKNSILLICDMKIEDRVKIGREASNFVKTQKNQYVQTDKLLSLTCNLFK